MQMESHTQAHVPTRFIRIFLLVTALLMSCQTPMGIGTVEDVRTVRQSITNGQVLLRRIKADFNEFLTNISKAPIAQSLLREPEAGGKKNVTKMELEAAFGTYTEFFPDNFDFIQGGEGIVVEYLNGIDLELHQFDFAVDAGTAVQFKVTADANNRGLITPLDEAVTLFATATRAKIADELILFKPSVVALKGTLIYQRLEGEVQYAIEMAAGDLSLTLSGISIAKASHSTYFRAWDVTNSDGIITATAPFWFDTTTTVFVPIDAFTWTALFRQYLFQDSNGNVLNVGVASDPSSTATQGRVIPTGSVKGKDAFGGLLIAQAAGGPYQCDITDPDNPASGEPIVVKWFDGLQTSIMPTAEWGCADAVLRQFPL